MDEGPSVDCLIASASHKKRKRFCKQTHGCVVGSDYLGHRSDKAKVHGHFQIVTTNLLLSDSDRLGVAEHVPVETRRTNSEASI